MVRCSTSEKAKSYSKRIYTQKSKRLANSAYKEISIRLRREMKFPKDLADAAVKAVSGAHLLRLEDSGMNISRHILFLASYLIYMK